MWGAPSIIVGTGYLTWAAPLDLVEALLGTLNSAPLYLYVGLANELEQMGSLGCLEPGAWLKQWGSLVLVPWL